MQEQLIRQECLEYNQRGITWKPRNREQSFLYVSHPHRPELIHIPIKLHEDIPKGY